MNLIEQFEQFAHDLETKTIQKLLDSAKVQFTKAEITELEQDGIRLGLRISMVDKLPVSATITLNGLGVTWGDDVIANIELQGPTVDAKPLDGYPTWEGDGQLKITDKVQFAKFIRDLLHEPSFEWKIRASVLCCTIYSALDNLKVQTLLNLKNLKLSKDLEFKSFNGLPGIEIRKVKLLSGPDGSASISLKADVDVPSKSQFAISLGTVSFNLYFEDRLIGRFYAKDLDLPAQATKQVSFGGSIDQPLDGDLHLYGILLSKFLQGKQQTLKVKEGSTDPKLTWLSEAFQALSLDVILHGEKFAVIRFIEFSGVAIKRDPSPHISSTKCTVTYENPFEFSFQVVEATGIVTLGYKEQKDMAQLILGDMPVFVEREALGGDSGLLQIKFDHQALNVLDDQMFQVWLNDIEQQTTLEVSGTVEVVVESPIGRVKLTDLSFSCSSELKDVSFL